MFSNTEAVRFKNRPTGLYSLHGTYKEWNLHQNNLLLCGTAGDGDMSGTVGFLRLCSGWKRSASEILQCADCGNSTAV